MNALAPQFFLPALHGGGAESHLLRILNAWPDASPLPRLWLARRGGSYEKQLCANVERRELRSARKFGATMSVLSCVPALRQIMRGSKSPVCPVLDFAVLAVDLARRALPRNQRPPFVILLQNNLSAMLADLGAPWKYLRGAILRAHRGSDGIVFLSQGVRQDFLKLMPDYLGQTAVIPNATWSDELAARSREACPVQRPVGKKVITACGRMHRQKGFDVLLPAFAKTAAQVPSELWLLGEGPNRAALEAQAAELGVAESVRFLGFQANPLSFFRAADLFVLSSRWEGFGNVVVEALGCGTPVLSTDCPFGPAEVLEDGRWGKLVPVEDVGALAGGMREILTNAALAAKLADDGPVRARQFEAGPIAEEYAEFLARFNR
jgi:glycosyltransferase involved in cell wall biosynthesis